MQKKQTMLQSLKSKYKEIFYPPEEKKFISL